MALMVDATQPLAAHSLRSPRTAGSGSAPPIPAAPHGPAAITTVPLPRAWGLRASDVWAVLAGNGVLILLMWVRHGNADALGSLSGSLTAVGQLTALFGTYLALIQLVMMSRSPFLDQVFGIDGLTRAHRWLGFATVWLIVGHVAATTLGYGIGDQVDVAAEFVTLVTTYPWVMWALFGLAAMLLVALTSFRAVHRRLGYETWFGLHLYAYLALALAFMHQLVVGADFLADPVARTYWIGLYAVAAALVLLFRFGQPILLARRHRLTVANVVPEAPGVVSIYVTGRDLQRLPARAGQFFNLRLLTRDGWYRAHPFSLSAAPNGRFLRFTIKALGDWSERLQAVRPGTRVMLEGPYGVLTGARRTRSKILLIGGGVGVAPLRALFEALPGRPGDLVMVTRAPRHEDVLFRDELERIAAARGGIVHHVVGRRGSPGVGAEPLGSRALQFAIPDIRERDIFVCGPRSLTEDVIASVRELGVAPSQLHFERFAYQEP